MLQFLYYTIKLSVDTFKQNYLLPKMDIALCKTIGIESNTINYLLTVNEHVYMTLEKTNHCVSLTKLDL